MIDDQNNYHQLELGYLAYVTYSRSAGDNPITFRNYLYMSGYTINTDGDYILITD